MADAFTVKDMELYYGSFHALKNVNLNIASGEITAFIGPSGCGKSTFLKSLNRMNDLVEGCRITGDIRLMGEDIYDRNMDVSVLRRRVGMVFQKPNPFPMSIYDNIAYGPRTHGVKKKAELDEIVEKSLRDAAIWDELKDRLKKSALGLSGGQQQRLCIARAGGEAGGDSDGRADQRARPDFHIQDRGSGDGHQKGIHHRDGDAQYAAGRPRFGYDRVLSAGRNHRERRDRADVLRAEGQAHGGLHHRPVWLRRKKA